MRYTAFVTAMLMCFTLHSYYASADEILYQKSGAFLDDGAAGQISVFQSALDNALKDCGIRITVKPDGEFGDGTKQAIRSLSGCDKIAHKLSDIAPVRSGAITRELWTLLLPGRPAPSPQQRNVALLLAFEATDYDRAEWNFCQNKPFYDPSKNQPRCVSNDKRSFLTWGPNGATAGWGQEVLAIASLVDKKEPAILDGSFGIEAPALRRAAHLDNSSDNSDLEVYLCGIWLDPVRRSAWKAGFSSFGRHEEVRSEYNRLYRSSSYDGGKIAVFYKAWTKAGLKPTEVDFGFFIDRAAHTTPQPAKISAALATAQLSSPNPLSPAVARRAVSLGNMSGNATQRADRLGRDVTYYVDGLEGGLSPGERAAWMERGARRSSDVGLSDQRPAPDFSPEAPIQWRSGQPAHLTAAERQLCPAAVLNPSSP